MDLILRLQFASPGLETVSALQVRERETTQSPLAAETKQVRVGGGEAAGIWGAKCKRVESYLVNPRGLQKDPHPRIWAECRSAPAPEKAPQSQEEKPQRAVDVTRAGMVCVPTLVVCQALLKCGF